VNFRLVEDPPAARAAAAALKWPAELDAQDGARIGMPWRRPRHDVERSAHDFRVLMGRDLLVPFVELAARICSGLRHRFQGSTRLGHPGLRPGPLRYCSPGMLLDTHCHLDEKSFPEGADAVLARARAADVGACVCIGVGSLVMARGAVSLAEAWENVVSTVGVHPHDASTLDAQLEAELAGLARHERVVAVGEVGLDYHYDHSPHDEQGRVFRWAIELARQVKKPLVIHTREAPAETLGILREEGARDVGGVIHCFSEDRAFAEGALELGFYLSFSGIVTFKNARSIHEVATFAPSDRILVETDSPYLAPVPLRGKKCEPAYVVHTARRLAELRGTTLDAIERTTTENAARAFGFRLRERPDGGVALDMGGSENA
jgi:TatD DNase family protein